MSTSLLVPASARKRGREARPRVPIDLSGAGRARRCPHTLKPVDPASCTQCLQASGELPVIVRRVESAAPLASITEIHAACERVAARQPATQLASMIALPEAVRITGVSEWILRRADDVLKPYRGGTGRGHRYYSRDRLLAWAAARANTSPAVDQSANTSLYQSGEAIDRGHYSDEPEAA